MAIFYHITTPKAWAEAQTAGSYRSDSLTSEGFIHCSKPAQIIATANHYYRGQHGLVLLAIASEQVEAEIRQENTSGGGELFPHIYGPLNLNAVTAIFPFEPDEDGQFKRLPEKDRT